MPTISTDDGVRLSCDDVGVGPQNVGHAANIEDPDQFNSIMLNFLATNST